MIYYIRDEEGSLIGLKYNDKVYYYIKNMQEDIIGITDENFNKIVEYEYDSWGNIITIKDNNGKIITDESHIGIINPFRYRSYYYDKETKLYYLNSRYYNPEWGRFINADSVVNIEKQILGYNIYIYTMNNPINNYDNRGSFFKKIWKATKNFVRKVMSEIIGVNRQTSKTINKYELLPKNNLANVTYTTSHKTKPKSDKIINSYLNEEDGKIVGSGISVGALSVDATPKSIAVSAALNHTSATLGFEFYNDNPMIFFAASYTNDEGITGEIKIDINAFLILGFAISWSAAGVVGGLGASTPALIGAI